MLTLRVRSRREDGSVCSTAQRVEGKSVRSVNTMKSTKKTKQENPFKLGAAVALFRPGSGVERLGQIVKITKSLLPVKWEDGSTELFGRADQEFYGNADESAEPTNPPTNTQI